LTSFKTSSGVKTVGSKAGGTGSNSDDDGVEEELAVLVEVVSAAGSPSHKNKGDDEAAWEEKHLE
jgi:hypothetical protein